MELALSPPPPASRPRRAGSRFHVTCTKRNGFWGRPRAPLPGAKRCAGDCPLLHRPARGACRLQAAAAAPGGRQARAHLGSGRGPRRAQVTRLARRPPSPTPGPAGGPGRCAPPAFCIWFRGSGRPRRRAGERTSRRLRLPFAHFLDSRHDPLDIIFGPAPGLGSNRPARHGSGGEREAGGARPPGPARAPRRPHSRPPARSLTHTRTHTHSHTYTHTQSLVPPRAQGPVRKRRAAAAPSRGSSAAAAAASAASGRRRRGAAPAASPPTRGRRPRPPLPGEVTRGSWLPPAPGTRGSGGGGLAGGGAHGHLLGGRRCRGVPRGERAGWPARRGADAFLGSRRGRPSAAPSVWQRLQ